MNPTETTNPQVTIVVVPRERFSYTRQSLESIYEHTKYPFELIYVDGGSPSHIKQYLADKAVQEQFQLIRTDYYLSPNHARNIGLRQVTTKYVVFIDNDVVVTPGWLEALVQCAEETKATVVSPLICQGEPVHQEVHCAGGESGVKVEVRGETQRRFIIEKIYSQGKKVADLRSQLQRQTTGLAEFHCMMVRTDIFQKIGLLDEALLNTKEHVDLCMLVAEVGGTVYLEPTSVVTYVPGPPLELTDVPYYVLRWSDAWELASLKHLRDKWNLTEDEYFQRRYNNLGGRRQHTIIAPLVTRLFGRRSHRVENLLIKIDRVVNRYLCDRYTRRSKEHNLRSSTKLDESAIVTF